MKSPSCRDHRAMSIVCHMRHALPLLFVLAACVDIPALEGTISDAARDAPYPQILPLTDPPAPLVDDDSTMAARIAALQRRADRLRATGSGALQ